MHSINESLNAAMRRIEAVIKQVADLELCERDVRARSTVRDLFANGRSAEARALREDGQQSLKLTGGIWAAVGVPVIQLTDED